jgi:hypothetical protein
MTVKGKVNLWRFISILSGLALGLIIVWLMRMPQPNRNRLAIGKAAKVDTVAISIQTPVELDFKTKAQVLQLRQDAVQLHPELLVGKYIPSEAVFGQIVDGLPWWGMYGEFYYGKGDQSIAGPSEETRFIMNPYLLAAPDFWNWWQGVINEADLTTFPLVCPPSDLLWKPSQAYAEVTYATDCIAIRQDDWLFDLIAYNARDLNLNYIYVSYADSVNVTKQDQPQAAYANPQFIHRGTSCGYPGGCNNMSPPTSDLDGLQLTGLPAKIMIWFWIDQPASTRQAPDMRFVIYFK